MSDADIIYQSDIDGGPGRVVVERTGHRTAILIVWYEDNPIYAERNIPLSYGAHFGPDVSDVTQWQEIALREHDEYLRNKEH